MKKLLFLFVVALVSISVTAQEISVETAMHNAQTFLQKSNSQKFVKSASAPQLKLAYTARQDDRTCFYVFNQQNGDGFVIAGGDEVANEILAYTDKGNFDYETANPNLKWWLDGYKKQIKYAAEHPSEVKSTVKNASKYATKFDVEILVPTRWDQETPYNKLIKSTAGKAYLTGCVATAMSQIMKTHEWPVTGIGNKTYYDTESQKSYTANFCEHTYDWANMLNKYNTTYTTIQADAVAQLMYDAGVSVEMQYNTVKNGGSGAMTEDCGYAFVNFFGYDKGVKHAYRDYYTDSEWADMLYGELAEGRPVMYGGVANKGGHSFICDGYQASTDTYHFNWGWSGDGDCYCSISAVKGGGYNWKYYQDLVYGIQKPVSDTKAEPNIILYDNCSMTITETKNGDYSTFKCQAGRYNYDGKNYQGIFLNDAWEKFDVLFTMKYVNSETGQEYYTVNSVDSLNRQSFISIYPISSNEQEITNITVKNVTVPKLPAGEYRVYLVYKDYADRDNKDNSLWKVVRGYTSLKNYMDVSIESSLETPVATEATDITGNGFTANWNATKDADFYNLELTTKEKGAAEEKELINEKFDKFTAEGSTDISSKLDLFMETSGWTGTKVFTSIEKVKLGSSSAAGSLVSPTLNATGNVKVTIGTEQYGTDITTATVKIGDNIETFAVDNGTHEFTIPISGDFNVTISSAGAKQRMYVNKIQITANENKSTTQIFERIKDAKYTFTDLSNEYDYSYRVRGGNDEELSRWSNSIDVKLSESAAVTDIYTTPIEIRNNGDYMSIYGINDNAEVIIYTADGIQLAQTISKNNKATLYHRAKEGDIVIVSIDGKAVKVRI